LANTPDAGILINSPKTLPLSPSGNIILIDKIQTGIEDCCREKTNNIMNKPLILAIAALTLLTGCVGPSPQERNHVDLVEYESGKVDVLITRRLWDGFWGSDGYIGYRPNHFRAGLRGNGPTYTNPIFQDTEPSINCIGSITLDREHNKVIVDMRRIVSKLGQPEQTRRHPANGTYSIESTREAMPGAPSL
jgi:hypothetical protein